jgi:GNAT superfamily N-acetyltransferase
MTIGAALRDRTSALCDVLEWDSAFFGRSIARYRGTRCSDADLFALSRECAARAIDCVYLSIDPADVESVAALTRANASFTDIRVTFETRIVPVASAARHAGAALVRPATSSDLPSLTQLAGVSHHQTRFYADPHFPRERCARLYQTWIARSCGGYADAVLVADAGEAAPVGYVTCHKEPACHGRIGLFAVADGHQGRGIGGALMAAALHWFTANGVTTISVATQLRSVRAIRVYERAGFTLSESRLWFHYWREDARGHI